MLDFGVKCLLVHVHGNGRSCKRKGLAMMDVLVSKTYLDQKQLSKPRDPGVKCLLYEAEKT